MNTNTQKVLFFLARYVLSNILPPLCKAIYHQLHCHTEKSILLWYKCLFSLNIRSCILKLCRIIVYVSILSTFHDDRYLNGIVEQKENRNMKLLRVKCSS